MSCYYWPVTDSGKNAVLYRYMGRDRPAGKPEWMTIQMTIFFCLILKHPLSYSFFGWVLPMHSVKASQL